MKTILITGGVGFIGSHTAEHLLKRGDRVIALDAFNFIDLHISRICVLREYWKVFVKQ